LPIVGTSVFIEIEITDDESNDS